MNGEINLFTLIALIVAVFAILKLRSVLGRKTGDEETRLERYRSDEQTAGAGADKVVTLPRRDGQDEPVNSVAAREAEDLVQEHIDQAAKGSESVKAGLQKIHVKDPNFDPDTFMIGAKQAYEMIVTAFAEGNQRMLKDLLSADVFEGFSDAIVAREEQKLQIDQSFVGIEKTAVLEADCDDDAASVTVKFVSQLITATRDAGGDVIDGDPQAIKEVTDIWTFSRDVSNARALANPNWKLIATQPPN